MRSTVEHGFTWIEDRHQPASADRWLLAPADHPGFAEATVRELLEASVEDVRSMIVPTRDGRRGHPVLFHWRHTEGIRSLPPGEGINAYLRANQSEVMELPVADPGIHINLDRPEDYDQVRMHHL
jgi:molybdenum cofactor cytidylyltransferase